MSRARNLVIGAFIGLSAAMLGASIAVRLEAMAKTSSSSVEEGGMWIYDSHTHYDDIEGVNGVQKGSESPNRYLLERALFGTLIGDDVSANPMLTEIVSGDTSLVKWGSYGSAAHTNPTATSITTYHGEEFYLEYSGDVEATYEVKTTVIGNDEIEPFTQTLEFVPDPNPLEEELSLVFNNPDGIDYRGGVTEQLIPPDGLGGFDWTLTVDPFDAATGERVDASKVPICITFDLPWIHSSCTSTMANVRDDSRFFAYSGEDIWVAFAYFANNEESRDVPWHATPVYPYTDQLIWRGTIRLTKVDSLEAA